MLVVGGWLQKSNLSTCTHRHLRLPLRIRLTLLVVSLMPLPNWCSKVESPCHSSTSSTSKKSSRCLAGISTLPPIPEKKEQSAYFLFSLKILYFLLTSNWTWIRWSLSFCRILFFTKKKSTHFFTKFQTCYFTALSSYFNSNIKQTIQYRLVSLVISQHYMPILTQI